MFIALMIMSLLLLYASVYVYRKANGNPLRGLVSKSANFVQRQTTYYAISNICCFFYAMNECIEWCLPQGVYSGDVNNTISIVFSNLQLAAYFLGVWGFAYKNWVISREMPKILVEVGKMNAKDLQCRYCIKMDWLSERGYKNLSRSI